MMPFEFSLNVPPEAPKLHLVRQLREMGLWDQVKAYLQGDPVLWEDFQLANSVERHDPIVNYIQGLLGISKEDVDDIFIRSNVR